MKNNGLNIFWTDTSEIVSEAQLPKPVFANNINRRINNFQNFRQRKLSLLSKCLLAHGLTILKESVPYSISFKANGKPYFENSNIQFNISHSGNLVICVIGKCAVGIDLQEIVPFRKGAEGVFLIQEEINFIATEDYLKVWSKKEATYKGFGAEYGSKLTDFRYQKPTLMIHPKGNIKIVEQSIIQGYYCYLAVNQYWESEINISKVSINQLIS